MTHHPDKDAAPDSAAMNERFAKLEEAVKEELRRREEERMRQANSALESRMARTRERKEQERREREAAAAAEAHPSPSLLRVCGGAASEIVRWGSQPRCDRSPGSTEPRMCADACAPEQLYMRLGMLRMLLVNGDRFTGAASEIARCERWPRS